MAKPSFLKGYLIPDGFAEEWNPIMSGWCNLHANLPEAGTHGFYAHLMILELRRVNPRIDVLTRLKGSFDIRRKRAELLELIEVVK
jgi:hypothetical protein